MDDRSPQELRVQMQSMLESEVLDRVKARTAQLAAAAAPAARSGPQADALPDEVLLKNDLYRIVAGTLDLREEQIDPEEDLTTYGVDSVTITALIGAISGHFDVAIPPTIMFQARHLNDLAKLLYARYGSAIKSHYAARGAEAAQHVSPVQDAPGAQHDPQPQTLAAQAVAAVAGAAASTGLQAARSHAQAVLERHRKASTPARASAPAATRAYEKLDPQARQFLEGLQRPDTPESGAAPEASRRTHSPLARIAAARERMKLVANAFSAAREPVSSIEDATIPGPAGEIPVRYYSARARVAGEPGNAALIYFHGGGFVAGTIDNCDALLRAIANRTQCTVASVEYRLAPEHRYPAAHDDAWAVLDWLHAHGAAAGIDAARMAVGGDSAGGLLAAYVAQKATHRGIGLRGQVLLYPNLDATLSRPSWQRLGGGEYLISLAQMRERFDAYLPDETERRSATVSPLFASTLEGVAPAFIATADHDPLCDEGDEYASRLRSARIQVDYRCWPGMIHNFATMGGFDAGKALVEQIASFLQRAVAPAGAREAREATNNA